MRVWQKALSSFLRRVIRRGSLLLRHADGHAERFGDDLSPTFDRVVSVGMFEHVGRPHYDEFFATVRDRLLEDGVALIHTIGRTHEPAPMDPWMAEYIFPGGAIPALSELVPAVERSGLILTDLEVWHLHYAETLRAWRRRFQANRQTIAKLYDERFCRM